LLTPVLYGLVLIDRGVPLGLFLSLLVSILGLFAFAIHTFFIFVGGYPLYRSMAAAAVRPLVKWWLTSFIFLSKNKITHVIQ